MRSNKAAIMEANTTLDTTLSGLRPTRSTPGSFFNGFDPMVLTVESYLNVVHKRDIDLLFLLG